MLTGTNDLKGYCEITSYGDIILIVPAGANTMRLRVSSHVLRAASSVFCTMLGPDPEPGRCCERRKCSIGYPYEHDLTEEYPHALTVVLLALHCRSKMVPADLTFRNLVELAIVCDKYDCQEGVLPWVETWTAPWKPLMLTSGYEEWLFIAWVFGIKEGFEELSKKLILECYFDPSDGELRTAEGIPLKTLTIPEKVLGKYLRFCPML
jgi:hypothetical protein